MNSSAMAPFNFVRFEQKTLIMKLNTKLCINRCNITSYLGLPKCVASTEQELSVLMCLRVHHLDMADYFLQPLPSSPDEAYAKFVPITRKQAIILDATTKQGVSVEVYTTIVLQFCQENDKEVLSRRLDVSGGKQKFIVSIVDKPNSICKPFVTKDNTVYMWENKKKSHSYMTLTFLEALYLVIFIPPWMNQYSMILFCIC